MITIDENKTYGGREMTSESQELWKEMGIEYYPMVEANGLNLTARKIRQLWKNIGAHNTTRAAAFRKAANAAYFTQLENNKLGSYSIYLAKEKLARR